MKLKHLPVMIGLAFASQQATAMSIEDKIDLLQEEITQLKLQAQQAEKKESGLGKKTTIGGYGELHYNHFSGDNASKQDEIDFHRFVLFFGHRFNDWISFVSEVELEHAIAGEGKDGEIELEQAYLDFNFNEKINAKAGVFLMPVGMINETHEPPTFFGVERNTVEKIILPATWWEAGAGIYGELAPGWKYQAGVTSYFNATKFSKFASNGVRKGRSKLSKAKAENFALSGRIDYSGIPGVTVGASVVTGNTGQDDPSLNGADARLTLWDLHGRYNKGDLDIRALYAKGHLEDVGQINAALGSTEVAPEFYGWYLEGAYKVWKKNNQSVVPFVRYEKWDTQSKLASSTVEVAGSENDVWTVGANYYPDPQVVLKMDYQHYGEPDGSKGDKRLNLGVGYMF